jgi:hypothetical protein
VAVGHVPQEHGPRITGMTGQEICRGAGRLPPTMVIGSSSLSVSARVSRASWDRERWPQRNNKQAVVALVTIKISGTG